MASLHTLVREGKRGYRRVGRGQGSSRGKQSGRGGKGQTARAGHKIRPAFRDILKKLPKRRGYGKNRGRTVDSTIPDAVALSLTRLEQLFPQGGEVTLANLREKGVIGRKRVPVKIVAGLPGQGETSKKFAINGCSVSSSARTIIEKAGGSVGPVHSSVVVKVKKVAKPKKVKPVRPGKVEEKVESKTE